MRVVVLGATGLVGTSVVRVLSEEPQVRAVVGGARRVPDDLDLPKVEWREADVVETDLVGLFAGADAVVHLVALQEPADEPDKLRLVNVDGTRRVLDAAAAAGVGVVVYGSSAAAYSAGPAAGRVDETWPLGGAPTSPYATQKAEAERLVAEWGEADPGRRVVAIRFSGVFKREAGAQARETFLPRGVPRRLIRPDLLPFVVDIPELRFQLVHADDLAHAFRLAVIRDARGAFNIAAEPVLDVRSVARLLGVRVLPALPGTPRALRKALWLGSLFGFSPLSPSWLDYLLGLPLLDATRARTELGWRPHKDARETFLEVVEGARGEAAGATPALGG